MENRKYSSRVEGGPKKRFDKPKYFSKNNDFKQSKPVIAFGVQSVLETLRSEDKFAGKEIDKILLQREFGHSEVETLAKERGVPVQRVPVEKLNRVTMKNHQGVIAFISAVNYAQMSNIVADVFEKGEVPLILVLDRITDVRNFGAIARTAECSGVHAIVVPARGGSQVNEDAMKTSSGALNYLPVCRENDLVAAIEELKMSGFSIVACTEKSDKNIYGAALNGPTAIVMGSEEDGISDRILELSDERVKIPMFGNVGSLNVSAATAVLLYEVVRQRTQE